jgi:hypothetical protein
MAEPSLQLGNGNWAGKSGNLLGYHKIDNNFYADELTFTRASSGTIVNAEGLIESVASGIPRVDYLNNANGSLLLEPQRTNLMPHSENYSVANWAKGNSSVSSNAATSPSGIVNADKLVENTNTSTHTLFYNSPNTPVTSGLEYSISFFAKADGRNVRVSNAAESGQNVYYNLSSGAIISSGFAVDASSMDSYGNGWYRCVMTFTASTSIAQINLGLINSSSLESYLGDGVSGVNIWGVQIEAGSYPTSYTPTSGTTVTRLGDASATTGLSDVIGQTEGTIYSEFELTEDSTFTILEINAANSTTNRILAYRNGSNIVFIVQVGNVIQINNPTAFTFASINKVAVTYKANDFKIYANGSLLKAYTSGSIPSSLDTLALADNNVSNKHQVIRSLMIFDSVLTNTELATLTTI